MPPSIIECEDFLAHMVPFLTVRDLAKLQRAGSWLNMFCGEVWLLQHMRMALHGGPYLSLCGARATLRMLRNLGILGAFKGLCAHGPAIERAYDYCAFRVTPRMYFARTDSSPYEVRKSDEWLYGAVVLQQLSRSICNVRAFMVDSLMRRDPDYAAQKYGIIISLKEVLLSSVPFACWGHRDLLSALLSQVEIQPPPMFATCLYVQVRELLRARRRAAWRQWRSSLGSSTR